MFFHKTKVYPILIHNCFMTDWITTLTRISRLIVVYSRVSSMLTWLDQFWFLIVNPLHFINLHNRSTVNALKKFCERISKGYTKVQFELSTSIMKPLALRYMNITFLSYSSLYHALSASYTDRLKKNPSLSIFG